MRVLIIDDEAEVASVLASGLATMGHDVSVAVSGAEGLRRVRGGTPDAVVLDVRMPGLSGIDVLRELRRSHPALPVILMTGYATADEIDEARRLGVADVVEKPWVLRGLQAALARLGAGAPGA